MKHPNTKIIMALFAIISLLDLITMLMVKIKQPYFNETNPIYLATNSIYILMLWKYTVVFLIILFFLKWYHKPPIYMRYLSVFILISLFAGQLHGSASNITAYNQEPVKVKLISKEVRQQHFENTYYKTPPTPISSRFIYILFVFVIWWQIEKEQLKWISVNSNI